MERIKLKTTTRKTGLKPSKLRKTGVIPAVVYNHGQTNHVQVDAKEVKTLFAHGVSESTLIDLEIDGKQDTVFVKDFQLHPVTDEVLHLDFYRITFGEKVTTHIGIHLEGTAIGAKQGGIMEVFLQDLEIELFPRYMVPSISIDISHLQVGDAIHVSDLQLPPESKVSIDPTSVVCQVSRPKKAEESDTEASEGAGEAAAEAEAKED